MLRVMSFGDNDSPIVEYATDDLLDIFLLHCSIKGMGSWTEGSCFLGRMGLGCISDLLVGRVCFPPTLENLKSQLLIDPFSESAPTYYTRKGF